MREGKPTSAESITTISGLDEIPHFESEQEEAEYWGTHQLSRSLWRALPAASEAELPPARSRTRSVAVRFDESTIQRMKALALRRNKGYQTMLKEFVMERLYEEEKREGLVG